MQDRFRFRMWHETKMHYNDFIVTATGYADKIKEEFLGNNDKIMKTQSYKSLEDNISEFIFLSTK